MVRVKDIIIDISFFLNSIHHVMLLWGDYVTYKSQIDKY